MKINKFVLISSISIFLILLIELKINFFYNIYYYLTIFYKEYELYNFFNMLGNIFKTTILILFSMTIFFVIVTLILIFVVSLINLKCK